MVVDFIKHLHRNSLEKAWNALPPKAAKDLMPKRRQSVLNRIDEALAQWQKGETNPPRGSYQTREHFNGVRVQLKCGQRALTIDGRDHWFVEDAETFFKNAREAVESGKLDSAINEAIKAKSKDKGKEPGADDTRQRKPLAAEKAPDSSVAADGEAKADEPPPPKPGRFAERYEKLLAAGTFSEPTP